MKNCGHDSASYMGLDVMTFYVYIHDIHVHRCFHIQMYKLLTRVKKVLKVFSLLAICSNVSVVCFIYMYFYFFFSKKLSSFCQ